jgi:hypothetical protein
MTYGCNLQLAAVEPGPGEARFSLRFSSPHQGPAYRKPRCRQRTMDEGPSSISQLLTSLENEAVRSAFAENSSWLFERKICRSADDKAGRQHGSHICPCVTQRTDGKVRSSPSHQTAA